MAITLPTDETGKLHSFTDEFLATIDIKRRGVGDSHDHVRYNLGPDGSGCTRKFSCVWDRRFDAAIYFAGAATTYVDGGGDTKISRLLPQRDPDYPNWVCTKVELMPWRYMGTIPAKSAGSEPVPNFDRCDLEATYEMVPFELVADDDTVVETQRYVTWPGFPGADITTTTDYVQMVGSMLKYRTTDGAAKPANVPIPYYIGFPENKSTIRFIWRRVPFDVWGPSSSLFQRVIGSEAGRGYIGAVNLTTFRGYPPAQLQLLGVEQRLLPDPTGLGYSWDLTFLASQKPVPYGQLGFYYGGNASDSSAGTAGYYQVGRDGAIVQDVADIEDDDSVFHVREFSNLLNPGDAV
jgi:hypothetical protein